MATFRIRDKSAPKEVSVSVGEASCHFSVVSCQCEKSEPFIKGSFADTPRRPYADSFPPAPQTG
jgi:hypothetical protein